MSTRFWKLCQERLAWLSAGAVFAIGTLVSPVAVAEDKPTLKVSPDEDGSVPADKAKNKTKNKSKDKAKETEQEGTKAQDPGVVCKYGVFPGQGSTGPGDGADKAAEKGAEKK
jgi:hypothetical protein